MQTQSDYYEFMTTKKKIKHLYRRIKITFLILQLKRILYLPPRSFLPVARYHPQTPCNYSYNTLVGVPLLSNTQMDQSQSHYLVHSVVT